MGEKVFKNAFVRQTAHFLGRVASTFVSFALKETEILYKELALLDKKYQGKEISKAEARREFDRLIKKLDVTLARLIDKGEKFEAQQLYHTFEKMTHLFDDAKLSKEFKKRHP